MSIYHIPANLDIESIVVKWDFSRKIKKCQNKSSFQKMMIHVIWTGVFLQLYE